MASKYKFNELEKYYLAQFIAAYGGSTEEFTEYRVFPKAINSKCLTSDWSTFMETSRQLQENGFIKLLEIYNSPFDFPVKFGCQLTSKGYAVVDEHKKEFDRLRRHYEREYLFPERDLIKKIEHNQSCPAEKQIIE